jgi:hypothetical protein
MAIKGKSKKRSAPKQVGRAPRREPVAVKPPFFQRRWVQLTACFLLGVFTMMFFIWVANDLRQSHADKVAADQAAKRRVAAQTWQNEVEPAMTKVGTLRQGLPPAVFTDMSSALDQMQKGTVPGTAGATFTAASKNAQTAIDTLTKFDLAAAIANRGLDQIEAQTFTDSKDRLIGSLQVYQKAAAAGLLATEAGGKEQAALTKLAIELRDQAVAQFQQAWATYRTALAAGGIANLAPGPIPGLPNGGA